MYVDLSMGRAKSHTKKKSKRKVDYKTIGGVKYEITYYDPKLDGKMERVPGKGKKAKPIQLKKGAPLYHALKK